jgi:DNA segregation ATPase FtsK/SpoIIIE, S-DNA-T family
VWLRVLGLPESAGPWWRIDGADAEGDLPEDQVRQLLRDRFPGYRFTWTAPRSRKSVLTVVARPASGGAAGTRGPGPEVSVVTEDGPDAGRLAGLPRSGFTVGRNHADWRVADPYLSAPHFHAAVEPAGIRISPLTSAVSDGGLPAPYWTGGTPFRAGSTTFRLVRGRPDGLDPAQQPPDPVVDPGPEPARPNQVVQVLMAAGPLVIGTVMAVVTGLWYFLLFSLVSVAVAGVMWAQHRSVTRRYGQAIQGRAKALRDRLDALAPTPGRFSLAARSESADRFGLAGAGTESPVVRWGTGSTHVRLASGANEGKWCRWTAVELPVVSALAPAATTVAFAERAVLDGMAHWLLVQLCRDAMDSGRGVLFRTARGDTWWGGGRTAPVGTAVCGPGSATGDLPSGWHTVHLVESGVADDRPGPEAADWLDPGRGTASLSGLEVIGLRWHGMAASTAFWLLDEIGATARPAPPAEGTRMSLPASMMDASAEGSLSAALSAGSQPVVVDLVAEGPHLLVAGTTGSGKSELLLTLLTSAAAAHPAGEVSFILMDFKGGSSFAPLAGLPHTMSVETNLSEADSLRTLDALAAELRRREELFLAAGVPDFRSFRRRHPDRCLPRLVVAIDELRVLVDDHPQAATLLSRLAATGRSLGFHLVVATQRAQGAVGPDMRSNLGTVICLRTATEQESWDLLGSAAAFAIGAEEPGRAFIKHGGHPPRAFQAGQYHLPAPRPVLRPWTQDEAVGPMDAGPVPWPEIVRRLATEATRRGLTVPEPVVTPALPDSWSPTPAQRAAVPHAVVVGLSDDPRARAQEPVRWVPGRDAPAAWIGTPAGGMDTAARSVVAQLAATDASPGTGPATDSDTVLLDGAEVSSSARVPGHWTVLTAGGVSGEELCALFERIGEDTGAGRPVRLLVTAWGRWAGLRVGTGYETVEERVATLLRDRDASVLAVALFGGRELAGGRVLGQIPVRYYLPAGTTPEHRMVWPALRRVPEIPGRAVMVSPARPAPGLAVQLAEVPAAAAGTEWSAWSGRSGQGRASGRPGND